MPLGAAVEFRTLGEMLDAPWLRGAAECRWDIIESAVDLVAAHYGLGRDLVWLTTHELESSWEEETGEPAFGTLLERPWGFTALGLRVAVRLLGESEAAIRPSLHLTYH